MALTVQRISNRALLKVSVLVALLMASFWVASLFPDLLIILITSSLVAFILRPLVKLLEFRFALRRSIAIVSVFVLVGGITALIGIKFIPFTIENLRLMYEQFRVFPFEEKLNEAAGNLAQYLAIIDAATISEKVNSVISSNLEAAGEVLDNLVTIATLLAIVPFVTYFILAESDIAMKRVVERIPNKYFEMSLNVLNKIKRDLIGYLRGWILDSVIVGILSVIGMYLIGIDYPILIGAIAGVANLVPYLGPVVGAVPAFLVSLTQYGDFRMAVPIIIVTIAIQTLDNTIIQPLSFSKTVDMHPLTVILVLVIGNELMGIAGMLLAIPIATILKVSAVETYWGLRNYRITA